MDPELSRFHPIGWRKRPIAKHREAQQVNDEKASLERALGIGGCSGLWKLVMDGANENPASEYSDAGYF